MDRFNQVLKNVVMFLAIFLVINWVMQSFFGKNDQALIGDGNLNFTTTDTEYSRRQQITLKLSNNTSETITIPNECPGEPFNVYRYENNEWVQKNADPELNCENANDLIIEPGKDLQIPYTNWNNALFSEMGRFKVDFTTTLGGSEKTFTTNEFIVVKEGIIRQLAVGLFYRPIYNALIFLIYIMPGHGLGWAIILLTLIIRTILLMPSQKAMRAQKRMQEIQPRIEKIKEKYKNDQQKVAMETMALWKEAQISPVSSCLPMLMQFPFLIALYYVIQGGLNPDNAFLLYSDFNGFNFHDININFLNILDLTKPNIYVLPLLIGGLQFIQMKLMSGSKQGKSAPKEMAMATNMMTYIMPVMIAVFTASLPAGVGLYWGTSTIYGIIQQLFINMSSSAKNPDEPTVRVIEN